MLRIFLVLFLLFNTNVFAEDLKKVYFGGGCFWCMEESFDKAEGVKDVISGYSGGTTKNPTYKEVTYGNTGHFEVVRQVNFVIRDTATDQLRFIKTKNKKN